MTLCLKDEKIDGKDSQALIKNSSCVLALKHCISVPSFELVSDHHFLVSRNKLESNSSLADSQRREE